MILILEDKKGFTKSVEDYQFRPEYRLPIFERLRATDFDLFTSDKVTSRFILFRFAKWLDRDREIALYKEDEG